MYHQRPGPNTYRWFDGHGNKLGHKGGPSLIGKCHSFLAQRPSASIKIVQRTGFVALTAFCLHFAMTSRFSRRNSSASTMACHMSGSWACMSRAPASQSDGSPMIRSEEQKSELQSLMRISYA